MGELWRAGITGKGVVVAILDSGCDSNHPDLAGRIIGGYNFTDDYDGDPARYEDNLQHGTHVAGIIAAAPNNQGVVGVAPEASLLILKVISKDGTGTYHHLTKAIHHAMQWRGTENESVRIITMSLGGLQPDPRLHDAIKLAVENNIMIISSSGNNGDGDRSTHEILYPAYYPEVVEVGAVSENAGIAPFSNTNDQVDIYAPGVFILSTVPSNQYAVMTGTSMAAPHVAGAAALLINKLEQSLDRQITERELYEALMRCTIITEQDIRLLSLKRIAGEDE